MAELRRRTDEATRSIDRLIRYERRPADEVKPE